MLRRTLSLFTFLFIDIILCQSLVKSILVIVKSPQMRAVQMQLCSLSLFVHAAPKLHVFRSAIKGSFYLPGRYCVFNGELLRRKRKRKHCFSNVLYIKIECRNILSLGQSDNFCEHTGGI